MNVREQVISFLIRGKLAEDTRTCAQMIDVFVANGDIYLVGTCESDVQRRLAEELVLGLPGVRHVIDNIRIRGLRPGSA